MKKITILFLLAGLIMSCASTGGNTESITDFTLITGLEWKLAEVRVNGTRTEFNRDNMEVGIREFFTVTFTNETISGRGSPNTYSAPYIFGANQAVSILPMRSTLMAALREPDELKEHDFFTYLQNTYAWEATSKNFTLLSKNDEGREVRLIFVK